VTKNKKTIFIPIDKQLFPTQHFQKIIGKKFTPVDME